MSLDRPLHPPGGAPPGPDVAASALRTLVLYTLMEFQLGGARTLRVTKRGREFGVADDGRGHPLDKQVDGTPYLRFIYTHFDYPFGAPQGAPVQLQGLGMSLVNALCSELTLTVRKPQETLVMVCRHGQIHDTRRQPAQNAETGITVGARLRDDLPAGEGDDGGLEAWLATLAQTHPTLRLFFNGRALGPGANGNG